MKAKITRGSGFRGNLEYICSKPGEVVSTNMSGNDPRSLAKEFAISRQLRPDCSRPVWHCSLTLPAGETLTAEKWDLIIRDHLQNMGLDPTNHQYFSRTHLDTDYEHVHIEASRIGLDGSIWHGKWEARKAIESTQALEKKYGLTITLGLENPKMEKRLSHNELNMAFRTGQEPPKQKLQRIINEAKQDKPSAPEFMERLMVAGVGVKANVATTGKMNGFSFEIDGISFKASQLGKAYTWKNLSQEVNYEQTQYSEELRRLNTAVASAKGTARLEQLDERIAGISGRTSISNREYEQSIQSSVENSASDNRSDIESYTESVKRTLTNDKKTSKFARRNSNRNEISENNNKDIENRKPEVSQEKSENHISNKSDNKSNNNKPDPGRTTMAWNTKFKIKSAKKRKFKSEQDEKYIFKETVNYVKQLDPTPLFEAQGYDVVRQGRHLSIKEGRDEIFRSTYKEDENGVDRWLHTRKEHGDGIGDNIDLIKELLNEDISFTEAVYQLLGGPELSGEQVKLKAYEKRENPQKLRLPIETDRAVEICENWLKKDRGISQETIDWASTCYFIYKTENGPLFVGYDNLEYDSIAWQEKYISKRCITPEKTKDGEKVKKRSFRGSDATYVPILPGASRDLYVVEGGIDALAVHDMHKRKGKETPWVIVTGGASNEKWYERHFTRKFMPNINDVYICYENEKDEKTQNKTDALHNKQVEMIKDKFNKNVYKWRPEPQYKDVADQNKVEANQQTKTETETEMEMEVK